MGPSTPDTLEANILSDLHLQKMIPDKLKSALSTIEEIENELLKNEE